MIFMRRISPEFAKLVDDGEVRKAVSALAHELPNIVLPLSYRLPKNDEDVHRLWAVVEELKYLADKLPK